MAKQQQKEQTIRDAVAQQERAASFHSGLKKRYGASRVATGAMANDPLASAQARKILSRSQADASEARSVSIRTNQLNNLIAESAQSQVSILSSIDGSLKKIERVSTSRRMDGAREDAEIKLRRRKKEIDVGLEHKVRRVRRKAPGGQDTGESSTGNFLKENLTIGNFLKYGAALVSVGNDAFQGYGKSKEWGTNPLMSGFASMLGGAGKGESVTNSIKKMVELGALGGMIAGPAGALIGAILGVVFGWIGGERATKFIEELLGKAKDKTLGDMKLDDFVGDDTPIGKAMKSVRNTVSDGIGKGVATVLSDTMERLPEFLFDKIVGEYEEYQLFEKEGFIEKYITPAFRGMKSAFEVMMTSFSASIQSGIELMKIHLANKLESLGDMLPAVFGDKLKSMASDIRGNATKKLEAVTSEFKSGLEAIEKRRLDQEEERRANKAKMDERNKARDEANSFENRWKGTERDEKGNRIRSGKTVEDAAAAALKGTARNFGANYDDPESWIRGGPKAKNSMKDRLHKGNINEKGVPTEGNPATGKVKRGAVDGSTLAVNQVPGSDIANAASEANAMEAKSPLKYQVPAEVLSATVKNESSGMLKNNVGDGGKSLGVTQMQQKALDDVNNAFGTSFAPSQIKDDYKSALKASALYMRLKLEETNGNIPEAMARYNAGWRGSAIPQAKAYSDKGMRDAEKRGLTSSVAPLAPKEKVAGLQLHGAAKENAALTRQQQSTAPTSVASTQVTQVNNQTDLTLPMPGIRFDDPIFMTSIRGR